MCSSLFGFMKLIYFSVSHKMLEVTHDSMHVGKHQTHHAILIIDP